MSCLIETADSEKSDAEDEKLDEDDENVVAGEAGTANNGAKAEIINPERIAYKIYLFFMK